MENGIGLRNKYVLVTGASSGIGFEIAKRFLAEGARVGAHYNRNEKGAQALYKFVRAGQCKIFQADFSKTNEAAKLWSDFIHWSRGRIDVLVNNAGEVGESMDFDELTDTAWDRAFQVNVKAPFFLSRASLKIMSKRRSGRIISISSIGVKFGGSRRTLHYSASKAALEAVTKSIAKIAAPFNVLVNVVRAGVTDTPFHKKIGIKNLKERIALIPLKRIGRPSEIAEVVIFLAGKNSSYVANTIIDVAGGE